MNFEETFLLKNYMGNTVLKAFNPYPQRIVSLLKSRHTFTKKHKAYSNIVRKLDKVENVNIN